MIDSVYPLLPLRRVATINDEALSENTADDYELLYIDIGNVDSNGVVHKMVTYLFEHAPSRARRVVRDGDIIISTVRTYLQAITQIKKPPDNLVVSTGFAVVRPNPFFLDASYCKYALRESSFLHEVVGRSVGVSYPAITSFDLAAIPIYVPSLDQQRAIANYLDREIVRIDSLIDAKESLLELLAEKRRAVISHAVVHGLNPNVPMRYSGVQWLGKIPSHWKTGRLRHLSTEPLAYGANESGLENNPNYPRFVRITDITEDGSLREETFRSLPPEVAEPYLLKEGDILFARSGATVGKAFMYQQYWGKACFAGYLIRFRCNTKLILPEFVFLFSQSLPYWVQIGEGTIQATIQNFSGEKYGDIVLPVPPLDEQRELISYLALQETKIKNLAQATQKTLGLLRERRRSIISAIVSGKMEVAG